jgi:uncharacterized membrane protein
MRPRKLVVIGTSLLVGLVLGEGFHSLYGGPANALAAGSSLGEQTRALLDQVLADESSRELVSRATTRSKEALSRAGALVGQAPAQSTLLEATALEWAEVGRDLQRARDAEQASDRLEQELSSLQTEIVRSRAAVEQAMARVGRARQELLELEASKPSRGLKGAAPAEPRPAEEH